MRTPTSTSGTDDPAGTPEAPAAPNAPAGTGAGSGPIGAAAAARGERVLVVDDSPQNRMVAGGHLEAAGYEVLMANSGEDALQMLEHETVDLIVLDVLMPGLGGFETCRRIRATPAIADTPILFLTALGDREATAPALEAGGDDLLPKPFHRSELLLRTKALIRQRRTTRQLQHAMRALSEQNETLRRVDYDKQRITQLIVHDLKGPIGAALANAELLRPAVQPKHVEVVEDIVVALQQLDRTARDLLDLSQAEAGELQTRIESFSCSELVAEVASSMRGLARWTGVEITLDVRADRITADRELLRRLLQNLLHNALKHAPHNTTVEVTASSDSDGFLLCVCDSGPGVACEDVQRIFERGVTLDADAVKSNSHGLGLAFCRLAAEAHHGRVWVEPNRPHGSRFCVRIPQHA